MLVALALTLIASGAVAYFRFTVPDLADAHSPAAAALTALAV